MEHRVSGFIESRFPHTPYVDGYRRRPGEADLPRLERREESQTSQVHFGASLP